MIHPLIHSFFFTYLHLFLMLFLPYSFVQYFLAQIILFASFSLSFFPLIQRNTRESPEYISLARSSSRLFFLCCSPILTLEHPVKSSVLTVPWHD